MIAVSVTQNIAILLNLAGCTVASLHPDPLATFSDSIVSLDDDSPDSDDEADGDQKMSEGARRPAIPTQELGKEEQFAKYAEAYYSTLFVSSPHLSLIPLHSLWSTMCIF